MSKSIGRRTFYLDEGVPEYWIVDGEERTICSARRGDDDVVTNERLVWEPAGASERFVIDVRAYFREALGVDALGEAAVTARSVSAPGRS